VAACATGCDDIANERDHLKPHHITRSSLRSHMPDVVTRRLRRPQTASLCRAHSRAPRNP